MNEKINKQQKTGKRLKQNNVKLQQLKNKQYIVTIPSMWANILNVKKGSVVTFVPGKQGGVEIIKVKE
ncbi:MAG: hypothetical protein U9O94_03330 [Nanoarchaeota archaeon]|nr:hypothetical protein [Nanoarchaeota archaeon]